MDGSILKAKSDNTTAFSIFHQQIQGKVLNEVIAVISKQKTLSKVFHVQFQIITTFSFSPQALTVQSVQQTVPGSVRHAAAPVGLASLAVLVALASEGPLVDLALRGPAEGHAIVLQLDHSSWCLSGHVVDGVLVSEPVRALDGVIHVPSPVVRLHVAEGRVDASLGGDGVAAGGEELGDDGGLEPLLNETESCSEAGTSSSNDDGIVLMVDDWVLS